MAICRSPVNKDLAASGARRVHLQSGSLLPFSAPPRLAAPLIEISIMKLRDAIGPPSAAAATESGRELATDSRFNKLDRSRRVESGAASEITAHR